MPRQPFLNRADFKAVQREYAAKSGGTPFFHDEVGIHEGDWQSAQYAEIQGEGYTLAILVLASGNEFVLVMRPDGPYPYASMWWEEARSNRYSDLIIEAAQRIKADEQNR